MIAIFLMLAAGQAAPSFQPPPGAVRRPDLTTTEPIARLTIPDEIAPAVVPYLECLIASKGSALHDSKGNVVTAAVPVGADCSSQRTSAVRNADLMLEQQGHTSGKERDVFIGKVLASIDAFPWAGTPSGSSPSAANTANGQLTPAPTTSAPGNTAAPTANPKQ